MVVFLSSIDVTFPESIQINRIISQPKDQQTWKNESDSFVVPSSACYQERIGTGSNYCNETCTKDDTKEQYLCRCYKKYTTVTYVNNTWMCLENKLVRNKLGEYDKYWVWEQIFRNPIDSGNTGSRQIHVLVTYSSRFNILRDRHWSDALDSSFRFKKLFGLSVIFFRGFKYLEMFKNEFTWQATEVESLIQFLALYLAN